MPQYEDRRVREGSRRRERSSDSERSDKDRDRSSSPLPRFSFPLVRDRSRDRGSVRVRFSMKMPAGVDFAKQKTASPELPSRSIFTPNVSPAAAVAASFSLLAFLSKGLEKIPPLELASPVVQVAVPKMPVTPIPQNLPANSLKKDMRKLVRDISASAHRAYAAVLAKEVELLKQKGSKKEKTVALQPASNSNSSAAKFTKK